MYQFICVSVYLTYSFSFTTCLWQLHFHSASHFVTLSCFFCHVDRTTVQGNRSRAKNDCFQGKDNCMPCSFRLKLGPIVNNQTQGRWRRERGIDWAVWENRRDWQKEEGGELRKWERENGGLCFTYTTGLPGNWKLAVQKGLSVFHPSAAPGSVTGCGLSNTDILDKIRPLHLPIGLTYFRLQ